MCERECEERERACVRESVWESVCEREGEKERECVCERERRRERDLIKDKIVNHTGATEPSV